MSKKMVWCLVGVTIAIAGIASASPAQSGGSVALVREGKPAATIVVAENPTRSAQFATAELQAQKNHRGGPADCS